MPGLPIQSPPIGSTPASASPTTVNGGGSSVDGPLVTSVALSGTASDPNQPIDVTAPPIVAVTNLRGDAVSVASPPADTLAAAGTPNDVNQTVGIGLPQTADTNVNGGTASPTSANVVTTQQNTVVGQVYGTGVPSNVFV
jgi:hypothetical protein